MPRISEPNSAAAIREKLVKERQYYVSAFREGFRAKFFEGIGRDRAAFLARRWQSSLGGGEAERLGWQGRVVSAAVEIFVGLSIASIISTDESGGAKIIYPELRFAIGRLYKSRIVGEGPELFNGDTRVFEKFSDSISDVTVGIFARLCEESSTKVTHSADEFEDEIQKSTLAAPVFGVSRGRIAYCAPRVESRSFKERKALLEECCEEFVNLCRLRSNEQPDLRGLADRYAAALSQVKRNGGGYRLFIVGLQIEGLLRIKASAPLDEDRNRPLDADLLHQAQAFLVAHAGFVSLFDDIKSVPEELDRYRNQMQAMEALTNRILEPAITALAASKGIFDDQTQSVNEEFQRLNQQETNREKPLHGAVATQHSWLRGALGAIGTFILQGSRKIRRTAGKILAEEAIKGSIKESGLFQTIVRFLQEHQSLFVSLADRLTASFSWLKDLFSYLGF